MGTGVPTANMPRDGSLTPADLIGKLNVLRVECGKCGRAGRASNISTTTGLPRGDLWRSGR